MLIASIEIYRGEEQGVWRLREVMINDINIVDVKEDSEMSVILREEPHLFPQGMNLNQRFIEVSLVNKTIILVEEFTNFMRKINKTNKVLLKG